MNLSDPEVPEVGISQKGAGLWGNRGDGTIKGNG